MSDNFNMVKSEQSLGRGRVQTRSLQQKYYLSSIATVKLQEDKPTISVVSPGGDTPTSVLTNEEEIKNVYYA